MESVQALGSLISLDIIIIIYKMRYEMHSQSPICNIFSNFFLKRYQYLCKIWNEHMHHAFLLWFLSLNQHFQLETVVRIIKLFSRFSLYFVCSVLCVYFFIRIDNVCLIFETVGPFHYNIFFSLSFSSFSLSSRVFFRLLFIFCVATHWCLMLFYH